ncbi:hypothetical protein ARMA_1793 [Ardenticatena maritima]|uniref:Uncharacterized protein n=1 Tax=Ardenticatena maritima TaxID=872965 RepID=A0A0M9UCY5_9CHLR|nr:hypothetical protein ARMA_1793 [Ardenticatena maritima]
MVRRKIVRPHITLTNSSAGVWFRKLAFGRRFQYDAYRIVPVRFGLFLQTEQLK